MQQQQQQERGEEGRQGVDTDEAGAAAAQKDAPSDNVCVCVYLSVCACVCSFLCVCLRKIFNLNDVSGNGRGGAAIGACKLSQQQQQHRQPG